MSEPGVDLLEEKSLFEIYVKSLRRLPPSNFNVVFMLLFFTLAAADCAYFPEQFFQRIALMRSLAELGMGFGSTILGFLIAGFTIFATLSKPELFKRMHSVIHADSGLSYLKVNFFVFVEVFAVYVSFLILCLCIKIFGGPGGFFSSILNLSERSPVYGYYLSKSWIANSSFSIFSTLTLYSLLALKSFIFNTYHAVVTSVAWSFKE